MTTLGSGYRRPASPPAGRRFWHALAWAIPAGIATWLATAALVWLVVSR